MRFYELDGGSISIDGQDITALPRGELRRRIGMVLRTPGSLRAPSRRTSPTAGGDATREEIVAAARAACCDHFIRTLPQGYDTPLSGETTGVSQGQMQLLTIARAMLTDPAILVLDEATSSVDTRTEVEIQKAMARLMEGKTSFVIAHRLSTIRSADLILVVAGRRHRGAGHPQGTDGPERLLPPPSTAASSRRRDGRRWPVTCPRACVAAPFTLPLNICPQLYSIYSFWCEKEPVAEPFYSATGFLFYVICARIS